MHKVGRQPSFSYVLLAMAAIGAAVLLWWQIGPMPIPAASATLHTHGALGSPSLVRIFVVSNLLTALAYVTISATLAYLVYRARQAIPFHWIVLSFGAFILACGTGHLVEVLALWQPAYQLENGVHSLTAFASVLTAVVLPPLVPKALRLIEDARLAQKREQQLERANGQFQAEATERQRLAEELSRQRDLYEHLLQGLSDLGEGVIFGEGDRFVFVNDAFCRISGYSRDELLNELTLLTLVAPQQGSASAARIAKLGAGQDIGSFEGALRHKAGQVIPLEVSSKIIQQPDRTQFLSVVRDITTRRAEAAELQASQARLAGILDTADDAIIALDKHQVITLFNQGAERTFGYRAAEILGQPIDMLLPDAVHVRHQQHIGDFASAPEVARKMGERQRIHGRRMDGSQFPAEASIAKLLLNQQTIFTVILRDITARLQVEAALADSERRFRAIFDQTFQFIWLLAPDGTLLEANQTALDFSGLTRGQVVGRPFWEARWWIPTLVGQERLRAAIAAAARGRFVRYEEQMSGPSDMIATIDFSLKPVYNELGQVQLLIPEGRVITEMKQAEQHLRTSLAEKEVLLKEVHHRVKNNLQVIVSLLRLQTHTLTDSAAVEPLRDSQNRVLAMALVHEQLYGSHDLVHLNFAEYVGQLARSVLRSYEADVARIRLDLQIPQPVLLDLEKAIPLGLILTELITNSVKHAFPNQHSGTITIAFTTDATTATLQVHDNGIGLAGDLDLATLASLGLKLVGRLVEQLEGRLEIQRKNGFTMQISVPLLTREDIHDTPLDIDRRG